MSIQQPFTPVAASPEPADSGQERQLPLMRVAWTILAGLTTALFLAGIPSLFAQLQTACAAPACFGWQLSRGDAQALQSHGLSMGFYAEYAVALNTLFVLSFLGVAVVIIWRKGRNRSAVLVALILTMFGAAEVLGLLGTFWSLPDAVAYTLLGTALVLLFYLFPNGKFVPRRAGWMVIAVLTMNLAGLLLPQWSQAIGGIASLSGYLTGIGAQIYRYRRVSTPVERQQTKWAVYGIVLAIMAQASLTVIGGVFPQTSSLSTGGLASLAVDAVWPLSYTLIPISIAIAILRSQLYDIDLIIRRTLVYGVLTTTLALLYWGGVVGLHELLRPLIGEGNDLVIVVTTLAVAALFNPLRRRIQLIIDRRFYRRKYDAAKTLASFSAAMRDEVDLERLKVRLVEVVGETMQPSQVSLWLRGTERE